MKKLLLPIIFLLCTVLALAQGSGGIRNWIARGTDRVSVSGGGTATITTSGTERVTVNTTAVTASLPVIVRQAGGVAGTDELQIEHNGTDVKLMNMETGGFRFYSGANSLMTITYDGVTPNIGTPGKLGANVQITVGAGGTQALRAPSNGIIQFFGDDVGPGSTWQVTDPGAKPTCDSSKRGLFWHDFGGAGVADTVEICSKNADDTYTWKTLPN